MKTFAATLLATVVDGSPCLCIFDVDSTLISWSTVKQCPKAEKHHLSDAGYDMLRSDGMLNLKDTFCGQCYLGVISAGSAGNTGGEERAQVVKYLKAGGVLTTDKWASSGCKKKGSSPLITSCSDKPSAVPGIIKYYEDSESVQIANNNVHFFDDQNYNIVTFEGGPYNAQQISCPTSSGGESGKCGMGVDELTNAKGTSYCCSGSQTPAPAPSSTVTTECGKACHFPFTYNGQSYSKCTSADDYAPWCATGSEYDGTNYGYCFGGSSSDVVV